jgi:phosphoribosyl 1,2-cyclic phosphate phosphodiesterase
MEIEFLGTGGAVTTPKPGCGCKVCKEARERGLPYGRLGPAIFVHGPNLLIDTPEEVSIQLNRSQVEKVEAGTYSHWHPDHVMGRRVWELLNADWGQWPPNRTQTPIFLPKQVARDFRKMLGSWDHFKYMEHHRIVELIELADGESFHLNGTNITPFRLNENFVYAFLFEENGKRALVVMDELKGWVPDETVKQLDLVVLPTGIFEKHPLTGQRIIAKDHPLLKTEATHEEAYKIAEQLQAKQTIFTHIEEFNQLSYDDLLQLETIYAERMPVSFAYDTLKIKI